MLYLLLFPHQTACFRPKTRFNAPLSLRPISPQYPPETPCFIGFTPNLPGNAVFLSAHMRPVCGRGTLIAVERNVTTLASVAPKKSGDMKCS